MLRRWRCHVNRSRHRRRKRRPTADEGEALEQGANVQPTSAHELVERMYEDGELIWPLDATAQ